MSNNAKSIVLLFATFVFVTVIFICAAFPATLPGDTNGDFAVNAADYVLLRKAGTSTATWRQNFGNSAATSGVTIPAGSDIQAAINANPANTIFYLPAGETRITSPITPKNGDAFVGAPGAKINGSRLLTSFASSSGTWYASGQTQQGTTAGTCLSAYSQCGHPEDVFIDDAPLLHVGSLSAVGPGKWYFDYAADRIYLGDNPAGHKVETSIASAAFQDNSSITNVTLSGLTIQKFAVESQHAAVESYSSGWLVDNCTVTLNHAGGVTVHNGTIRNSRLNKNGQWGVHDAALTENNELAYNNYAGYDYNWEAGGAKFFSTSNFVVRGNYVHDNFGQGLWDDTDCNNVLYENNIVTNNYLNGIYHEVGQQATIRNNRSSGNGRGVNGGYAAQITVYSSSNTEVYGNRISSNVPSSDGILVIQEQREGGRYAHDDYVHDNTITLGPNSVSGLVNYSSYWPANANIKFDYNTYGVADSADKNWGWKDPLTWSAFRADGQELHGLVATGLPPLPGDYNQNGIVDTADYIVWRKNVNTVHVLANDMFGGLIGQAQYDQWRTHFGQTAGSGVGANANAAVPEPTTLVLVLLGTQALLSRRRRAVSLTHEWATRAVNPHFSDVRPQI
jgi:Right handed beta helix region